MIQIYLLSVFYLVFSSLLLLVDSYRRKLSFMLKPKSRLRESARMLNLYFLLGLAVSILLMAFPMEPGPRIVGDIVPAVLVMGMAFFFRVLYSERNRERSDSYLAGRKMMVRWLGFACLAAAFIHFLFPSMVLI